MTFKQISIENCSYYFFSDMININNFDHVNIESKNSLYLIFNNVDGYIEESNGNKYLIFASTYRNKEIFEKYTKFWSEIKNQIKTINGGKPIEYKKDFMKSKFESDDHLPSGKILSIPVMVITGSVFQEYNRYYPHVLFFWWVCV